MIEPRYKKLLVNLINEAAPDIDTSESSNFSDLFIAPLSLILQGYEKKQTELLNSAALIDVEAMSETDLDKIASNFLISRDSGSYHTGKIKIYYSSPVSVNLPANTSFISRVNGKKYVTIRPYVTNRADIENNQDGSLFHTADISVRSFDKVSEGFVPINSQLDLSFIGGLTPSKIVVSEEISGGSPKESNAKFFERIKNTLKTNTLASNSTIASKVSAISNDILGVKVVGAGDQLMLRDLVVQDGLEDSVIENFKHQRLGYSPSGHTAFVNYFPLSVPADAAVITNLPSPDNFFTEFSDDQYRGIYSLAEAFTATQDQSTLVSMPEFNEEMFNQFKKWDGNEIDNLLVSSRGVSLKDSEILLGYDQRAAMPISINIQQFKNVIESSDNPDNLSTLDFLQSELLNKVGNISPVITLELDQHVGIEAEFVISSNDRSPMGQMCYMTFLRNNRIRMPHDGYGIAYRKQPDFLVRLDKNDYPDPALKQQDIETFKDIFNIDPVTENLVGQLKSRPEFHFYNVYLVDNNVLNEEIQVGSNRVFDSINGINQFLQKGKVWITTEDTNYFKITISQQMATVIFYKNAEADPYNEVLTKGATFPQYIPNFGDPENIDNINIYRNEVGIGIQDTKNGVWKLKSIFIKNTTETYPMHLFRFNVDSEKWDALASSNISFDYWGSGEGRVQLYVWKSDLESWEFAGENVSFPGDGEEDKRISYEVESLNTYSDSNNQVFMLAVPSNFSDDTHNLTTNYVQLSNPNANQRHMGNAIDVYCHAPDQVSTYFETLTVLDDNSIILTTPYICDIDSVRETFSNIEFNPKDYSIYNLKRGETFGFDNRLKICFNQSLGLTGASVTVKVKTWIGGDQVKAFLTAPENRYPAVSLKEKISPYTFVTIEKLHYSGPVSEEKVKSTLRDFIVNIKNKRISKSEIINLLFSIGVTDVSLDIQIKLKNYNSVFTNTEINMDSDFYNIPDEIPGFFYTNEDKLIGVLNV